MGVNYLDGNHNQTDEFDNSCLKACSVVRSYKLKFGSELQRSISNSFLS